MADTLISASALELDRCPQCRVANPLLSVVHGFESSASSGTARYRWRLYICSRCGLPVIGGCRHGETQVRTTLIFPKPDQLEAGMPGKAQAFLSQALECIHAPSGAIMLCASAVDAMLKEKGLKSGSLYARIEKAAENRLITQEMALWAHEVRLDANDERHADDAAPLPNEVDAKRCIDFVRALADFLFILPSRVAKGRAAK